MLRKVAIAQGTPTQAEMSLPFKALCSWDETHAKRAETTEDSTIKVYVTKTVVIDVEEGRVAEKVQDQSRYLSGSKLIFLSSWVYHKPTTQFVDPIHQRLASLYFSWYVRSLVSQTVQ